MFRLSLRKILTLFGLVMMLFVIVNVQFGSVAPQVIDGADGYKLDAFLTVSYTHLTLPTTMWV